MQHVQIDVSRAAHCETADPRPIRRRGEQAPARFPVDLLE